MTPRHLAAILATCWVSLALGLSGLVFVAWNSSTPVAADTVKGVSTSSDLEAPVPSLAPYPVFQAPARPNILATQYALYNPESGKTLLASSKMDPVPIASTTKLMTAYLLATSDPAELDTVVTISTHAASQIPSVMGLVPGEKITMRSLLYGAMLVSGNDAANALGELRGEELLAQPPATSEQKVTRFVEEMNAEAAKLHMDHTHYADPAGLDDATTSTAEDLAKIATLVATQPVLKDIIHTSDITVTDQSGYLKHVLHNSNRLLADAPYEGTIGGKTGYTDAAGHCLISVAKRGDTTLVAVILGTYSNTTEASAQEARKLLDIGFSNLRLE